MDFCKASACIPYPVTEDGLCRFVAYLADSNLKHQTIKSCLSATRFGQIMAGFGDPFVPSMPILEYLLRGISTTKRSEAQLRRGPRCLSLRRYLPGFMQSWLSQHRIRTVLCYGQRAACAFSASCIWGKSQPHLRHIMTHRPT